MQTWDNTLQKYEKFWNSSQFFLIFFEKLLKKE